MDEKIINLIKQWHIKANNDLITIKNELYSKTIVTDTICFHAQHSVEKFLKSYLIASQIQFRNTHNITEILRICIEKDKDFEELTFAIYLTNYAVELRYPDDFFIPDLEEAKKAYEIALKVKSFVIKKIDRLLMESKIKN